MKNFSSRIEYIKKNHLILNKNYSKILDRTGFDSFESVWRYSGGETIKNISARSVTRIAVRTDSGDKVLYIKKHKLRFAGMKRLISAISPKNPVSEGMTEFKNICDFRKCGLPSVSPVAVGEKFVKFFWVESFLITEDFAPYISLEEIVLDNPGFLRGSNSEIRKKNLIKEAAVFARRMHKNGFNHRDFNATHILLNYKKGLNDPPGVALFDLQRVDRGKFFRLRWIIKSLSELNYTLPEELFSEKDRLNLLLYYKGKTALNEWDRFQWLWIKKKTARIKRHTENILRGKRK